ncbi:hypothetical protein M513_13105 [Trichuris suis]|uniref:Uncharacterized protein n=1 Tax=Trichuris suis TaxID=68888 RepID=A0A085LM26_9BILA|nr:hypothetical protein M513_13105 [Trichuris suis]
METVFYLLILTFLTVYWYSEVGVMLEGALKLRQIIVSSLFHPMAVIGTLCAFFHEEAGWGPSRDSHALDIITPISVRLRLSHRNSKLASIVFAYIRSLDIMCLLMQSEGPRILVIIAGHSEAFPHVQLFPRMPPRMAIQQMYKPSTADVSMLTEDSTIVEWLPPPCALRVRRPDRSLGRPEGHVSGDGSGGTAVRPSPPPAAAVAATGSARRGQKSHAHGTPVSQLTVVTCVNDLRTSCTPWSVFQDGSDGRLTQTSHSSPRPTGRRRRLASQQRNRQPRNPPQKQARGEPVLKGDWSKMVERTPGPPRSSAWSTVGSAANARPLARTFLDCQSARSSRAFRWATGGKRQDGAAAKPRARCDKTEGRPSVNDERSRQAPSSRRAKQRTRCCCDNERQPMLRPP